MNNYGARLKHRPSKSLQPTAPSGPCQRAAIITMGYSWLGLMRKKKQPNNAVGDLIRNSSIALTALTV